MTAPFTVEQFLGVFAAYNAAIWPIQILAYCLGLIAVAALWFRKPLAAELILSILALMWALNGIGYHFLFFAAINPIAKVFAAFFVLQSILFAVSALVPSGLRFEVQLSFRSVAGLSFIVYAQLIYEFFGYWAGHGLMAGPMFGVAPCPTTIFTIGMLLLARGRWVVWLSIIPYLWSLVGLAAALQLGIPEDFGLPVAGLVLAVVLAVEAFGIRGRSSALSVNAHAELLDQSLAKHRPYRGTAYGVDLVALWVRSHPVLAYYALVFAISWGGMLIAEGPSGIFGSKANPAELIQFVYLAALAGPSVAGILMTGLIRGRAGLREMLSSVLRWEVGVRWYLVALLTAPVLMAGILFVLSLTSPAFVPAIVTTDDRANLLISGIVLGLVVSFFEELGWTGFATPELLKSYGFLATGVIIGVPWGAWHYPLFSGSASSSGAIPPALYIAVLLFSFLIPYRILMLWIYGRTKSVLVVMLMHAPLAAGQVILLPPAISGERAVTFDFAFAAALWVVVTAVYLTIGAGGRGKPLRSVETPRPQP